MLLCKLLQNLPCRIVAGQTDTDIKTVTTDSRKAAEGVMFAALSGLGRDGHSFVANAMKNGVSAVLVEKEMPIPDGWQGCMVVVPDSRVALSYIMQAFYGYPAQSFRLIAVTGTNGKTTVTHLIKQVLDRQGYKTGLIGTNHHLIGKRELPSDNTTPEAPGLQALFRQMADENADFVIMEASSHALALHRLEGLTFETGIFTNLTEDHLDFHKTMDAYCDAKAILFKNSRHAVINADSPYGTAILRHAQNKEEAITYGIDTDGVLVAKNIEYGAHEVRFTAQYQGQDYAIRLGIPGRFSVYNALAAIGACLTVGISPQAIADALSIAEGVKGRAETLPLGLSFTVMIDYAHTPDGVENILKTVRGYAKARILVVFGCGGNRQTTKRPIMGHIAGTLADLAIVTSDNPRLEEPEAIIADILEGMHGMEDKTVVIPDRRKAIAYALSHAQPDDIVVLAGKGHEPYQDIGGVKTDFDEHTVVVEEAKALGLLS